MTNEIMGINELIIRLDEKKIMLGQAASATVDNLIGIVDDVLALAFLLKRDEKTIGFVPDAQDEVNPDKKEETSA